jgi:hypothetical protein
MKMVKLIRIIERHDVRTDQYVDLSKEAEGYSGLPGFQFWSGYTII